MAVGKMFVSYDAIQSLYAEFILDDALRKFKEKQLYDHIDNALARRDIETFLTLSGELKTLRSAEDRKDI